MRLDKYLKVSRIIKRRTIANEACDSGRVKVNEKPVKASYQVSVGDIIDVRFGNSNLRVRVISLEAHISKDDASSMYSIIDNE